jgi:hypothetical protein
MEFPQVEPNTSDSIDLGEAGRLLCELGFFNKGYGPGTKLEVLQIDMPVGKVRTREELLELGRLISKRGFALRMVPDPAHPGKPELRADPLIGMEMYPHGQLGSWNDGQSSQANHRLRPSDENSPTKAETFGEEFYYKVVLKQRCWTFDNKASARRSCAYLAAGRLRSALPRSAANRTASYSSATVTPCPALAHGRTVHRRPLA